MGLGIVDSLEQGFRGYSSHFPKGLANGRQAGNSEWRAAHKASTSTPEFAEKSRQALLERLPTMRGPAVNTPIERRLHDALKAAGIGFRTQSLLLGRYLVDIELQQRHVVIEADGAQHTLPQKRKADAERDADLKAAGWRVFRFTGSEINADAARCVRQVIKACRLRPDADPVFEIVTRFAGPAHPNWKGGAVAFTCENPACGKVFYRQPTHRQGKRAFCSHPCYSATLKGATRSR